MRQTDPAKVRSRYFGRCDPPKFPRQCQELLGPDPVGAEKVLRRHGMLRTAETIRARTRKQVLQTLCLLGLIDAETTEPAWEQLMRDLPTLSA